MYDVVCGAGTHLCRRRGRPFFDRLVRAANYFHWRMHNVNFEMTRNGELRVLRRLAVVEPKCLFDVGANYGEWSQQAARMYPSCAIHAFEIVPSTYEELLRQTRGVTTLVPNSFGLSDETGTVTIHLARDDPLTATACKIEGMRAHEESYDRTLACRVRKAADYVREKRIDRIDFVKIDVEGMDLRVIKGFEEQLALVRALQFEYGHFNIGSRDLLRDFCRYLNGRGFVVGKVLPRWVEFFEYHFDRENFYGSNYLAVRQDEEALIRSLSQFGA